MFIIFEEEAKQKENVEERMQLGFKWKWDYQIKLNSY